MAIFDNANSVRSLYERQDADGKIFIKVNAHGALTAKTPYLVYTNYEGPTTLALFDSGMASTTAAGSNNFFKVGVPEEAIASGVDGWIQVGGYCGSVTTATLTCTASCQFRWVAAAVARGTPISSVSNFAIDTFAIGITAASATQTHTMYLLNRFVMGTT